MDDQKRDDAARGGQEQFVTKDMVRLPTAFSELNRVAIDDIRRSFGDYYGGKQFKFQKHNIQRALRTPKASEKYLRRAVRYIYNTSSHFRRLIQYFVGLTDWAYIVSPYRTDPQSANVRTTTLNYRKVLNLMSIMNVKSQFAKILTVCLREDVFFGTFREASDSITIQQLPSDFCRIESVERNVPNVSFDFSYFDSSNEKRLAYYPDEFRIKYEKYKTDRVKYRWIELDAPNSFAVKCNDDILDYAIPPFVGIIGEILDLDDFKNMKKVKTALENYAMLVMKLKVDDDGHMQIPLEQAKSFYHNLDDVLPEEVGSVLSPMDIDKISFERSNTGDADTVSEAEQNIFTAAGVSALLFNNASASANALLLSIKVDQSMTFKIVKSIEDAINRFIQDKSYGKYFKITFLDVSPFNRKEMADAFLKDATYGFPTLSMLAATEGLSQSELDNMSFLEDSVLGLKKMFKPLQSSATLSSSGSETGSDTLDVGGAPTKDIGDLTDAGEATREQQ